MEFSFREILLNGIDDMVFIVKVENQNFRYEFLNNSAMQGLGLNKSIIGLTFKEVLPKEKAEFLYKKYHEVLIKKESITYEDSYRKKEHIGEKHYAQVKLTPIFDGNSSCIRIVSVVRDITKEKAALTYVKEMVNRIAESNERYQSLFTHNPDAIVTMDKKGFITDGNAMVSNITGFEKMEILGKSFKDFIYGDKTPLKKAINETLTGMPTSGEYLLKNKIGDLITISLKIVPLILEKEVIGLYGIFKDITEVTKNIERLEESEKRFRIISENAQDLITLVNSDGKIIYVSPSYNTLLGYSHKEYIEKHLHHNVHPEDLEKINETIKYSIKNGVPFQMEFRQHSNTVKEWIWCESIGKPVFNNKNKFQHLVILTRDITLRKEFESKLMHFAYHDSLTGLPNRLLFSEKFKIAKSQFLQNNDGLAIMILDIDRFKYINDTYGHDVGDSAIKEFGFRIRENVRDLDTVARLGGDEFIILLPKINNEQDALEIAKNIKEAMKMPWQINGETLAVTTSIGIAIAPFSGNFTKYSLMKKADIALYEAKADGRNTYKLYSDHKI